MFTYDYDGDLVYYYCRVKTSFVMSTSDENPGRRFFGCGNYKVFIYQKC